MSLSDMYFPLVLARKYRQEDAERFQLSLRATLIEGLAETAKRYGVSHKIHIQVPKQPTTRSTEAI